MQTKLLLMTQKCLHKRKFMIKKVNNCGIIRTRLYKWRIIVSKISYKKLFKKMIDLDMKNTELMEKAEISWSTFYKMKKSENITTDVIVRICDSLNCDINEVMELVNDENN